MSDSAEKPAFLQKPLDRSIVLDLAHFYGISTLRVAEICAEYVAAMRCGADYFWQWRKESATDLSERGYLIGEIYPHTLYPELKNPENSWFYAPVQPAAIATS